MHHQTLVHTILITKVWGHKCFDDNLMVNWIVHETFKGSCLGLLDDNNEFVNAII